MDGFISVKGSDQVLITDSRCRTQYENFPVDIVVHEWANCAAIKSPGLGLVGVRNIFTENWDQGGTNKKYYHNDYKIAFKPNFGTGNELSIKWTARHYQVTPGPRALLR